jgi:tripartite-type tricarboxylate transporter receptor subunit TctC
VPSKKNHRSGWLAGSAGRAITELGQDAELQAKILAQGIVPRSVGLGDFDAHIRREMDRLDPLLKNIGSRIGN